MIVNGIVAEYNPFHNGHKHQLTNAKKATSADYTIVAMSGNFMQRGAPALLHKYRRTEMALSCGADLVLELPIYYALSSAELFATGAIALLDKIGVTTHLCFGSECGDVEVLKHIAQILAEEPEGFCDSLRYYLRRGLSYPTARTLAITEYDPSMCRYKDIFGSPNNILGIEYLKALLRRNSAIKPYTTLREGAGYHDIHIEQKQCSALAIRQAIFARQNTDFLSEQMPEEAYKLISSHLAESSPLQSNDFSAILFYKLLSEASDGFTQYMDVSSDLSDRICKNLYQFKDFNSFCDILKSKDMTYTRISRSLFHILLNMKKDTLEQYRQMDYVPYARVLGFRKDAAPLLSAIKEKSSIPLLTKLADAKQILSPDALAMLEQDICMNRIYEGVASLQTNQPMRNEFRTPIVII